MAQDGPKICPRLAQDGTRSAQDGSKDDDDNGKDDDDDNDKDDAENRTRATAIFLRTSYTKRTQTGRNNGYPDFSSNDEGLYPTIRGGPPRHPPNPRL